jgi:hypothetical protein
MAATGQTNHSTATNNPVMRGRKRGLTSSGQAIFLPENLLKKLDGGEKRVDSSGYFGIITSVDKFFILKSVA